MARPSGKAMLGRWRREEDGQLLIWLIGLILMVMMVLALGWDASNWLIGRRVLSAVADGAAIAAASDLDEGRYYESGGRDVELSPSAVRATVAELTRSSGIQGLEVTAEVESDPGGRQVVTVRVSAPVASVFLQYLGVVAPVMRAEATATPVRVPAGQQLPG